MKVNAVACSIAQADEFIQEFKDGYDTKIETVEPLNQSGERHHLYCNVPSWIRKFWFWMIKYRGWYHTDSLIRQGFASSLMKTN